MSLTDEYRSQRAWRSWSAVWEALPDVTGQNVWDLGCALGDQAAALVERGAHVTGFDLNEELLAEARARGLPRAEFRKADLRLLPDPGSPLDGIWCSFAAAYFTDLPKVLGGWRERLRPGGWIALTEVDDLFAHAPLEARAAALLDQYVDDSLAAGRYDFRMGRRLADHLRGCGFEVEKELVLPDREFSFRGPAQPEVALAWEARFERMRLLRDLCGREFDSVRRAFLECLGSPGHSSAARVHACVATR